MRRSAFHLSTDFDAVPVLLCFAMPVCIRPARFVIYNRTGYGSITLMSAVLAPPLNFRMRDKIYRCEVNTVGGTGGWEKSVWLPYKGYLLKAHYCQHVSLHCGGWHSCGCAGLNLHCIRSHLIFTSFSNTPRGPGQYSPLRRAV